MESDLEYRPREDNVKRPIYPLGYVNFIKAILSLNFRHCVESFTPSVTDGVSDSNKMRSGNVPVNDSTNRFLFQKATP